MGTQHPCLALIVTLAFAPGASAFTIIDSTPADVAYTSFGEGTVPSFGQTFTPVGADTRLTSITFSATHLLIGGREPATFSIFVAPWDSLNEQLAGPSIFMSSPFVTVGGPLSTEFTAATGGLDLVAGQRYMAFVSTIPYHNSIADGGVGGAKDSSIVDAIAGELSYASTATSLALLESNPWSAFVSTDAAVRLVLVPAVAPVPEPSSLALLGAGLVGLFARRHRAAWPARPLRGSFPGQTAR